MDARTLGKLKKDLTSFLDEVAGTLGNPRRRRWCESYLRGVLLDGHRKSVEPMAARLKVIEQGEHDYEQGLQQFLNQSPWDEQAVLDGLQHWIARQFGTNGVLIIDDTGFPKQGKHSVGVARQYHKLSAGKEPRAACWLLAEWPEGDAHPAKYFFSNLPAKTSLKRLVATAKSRWWVETCQAGYPSRARWACPRRTGYHRDDGVARAGRVVPATARRSFRRIRMFNSARRPLPPRP